MKGQFFRRQAMIAITGQVCVFVTALFSTHLWVAVAIMSILLMVGQVIYALVSLPVNKIKGEYPMSEIWLTILFLLLVTPVLCTSILALQMTVNR